MTKKSHRNELHQPGKPEKAQGGGYLPSVPPEHQNNPASFTGAGVEIANRFGMEPYTEPGHGNSHLDRNDRENTQE